MSIKNKIIKSSYLGILHGVSFIITINIVLRLIHSKLSHNLHTMSNNLSQKSLFTLKIPLKIVIFVVFFDKNHL